MMLHRRAGSGTSRRFARLTIVALVAALTVATGCDAEPEPSAQPTGGSPAVTVPAGTSIRTIQVDGRKRTFRLYRPPTVTLAEPVSLVVMLHGALGTGEQAESSYGWDAEADKGGFLVVYPDGLNRAWAVAEDCCGVPARDGVDDVGFITRLVATLADELPVDPARVYAAGISNGGMLAYRLACDTSVFAAIAPVSATLLGDCPSPDPVSVIHIHGDVDRTVPYAGGPGKLDNGGEGRRPVKMDGPPIPELIDRWRKTDGCGPAVVTTDASVTTSVADCSDGRQVMLITIAGAGHQWPGGVPQATGGRALRLDPPSTALNATERIWRFFQSHAKPA